MRRIIFAVAAAAALAGGLVAQPAAANKCGSNIIVFSYVRQNSAALDINATACDEPEYQNVPVDGRIIYPRTVQIQVRFSDGNDHGPQLTADLDGLGFTPSPTINGRLKLLRTTTDLGGVVYDSAVRPVGATAAGCLFVSVYPPTDDLETPEDDRLVAFDQTAYHTLDANNLENPCG